jgi:hypothetical protein
MEKDDTVHEYDRLAGNMRQMDWRKDLNELHERLRVELAGCTLPEPEEIIRQGREDRDVQLFMALGDDLLRPIASKHGVNWDEMTEEEREQLIRDFLQEE